MKFLNVPTIQNYDNNVYVSVYLCQKVKVISSCYLLGLSFPYLQSTRKSPWSFRLHQPLFSREAYIDS